MDRELLAHLGDVCTRVLEGFSHVPGSMLEGFPDGKCGLSAELIGRLLVEEFGAACTFCCGVREEGGPAFVSHAWLEVGHYILDVTHQQFDGTGLAGVIFPVDEPWYTTFFEEVERNSALLRTMFDFPLREYAALKLAISADPQLRGL